MRRLNLPFVQLLTTRQSKSIWRASAPLVEIQPEVKVMSREKERERRRKRGKTRGVMSPRKPGRETSSRNWSEKLAPSFIVQKAFYTFDKTWRSMGNTKLCSFLCPDSFCTSFCKEKVSGDLHYHLAKRLVNTFWLSSLMNVNFVSPEVFFFKLHLLKALKLHLYKTKVQWVITKKVLNS